MLNTEFESQLLKLFTVKMAILTLSQKIAIITAKWLFSMAKCFHSSVPRWMVFQL